MIKKIIVPIAIITFLFSCKGKHSTQYATVSGLIANNSTNAIVITSKRYTKTIAVNPDGSFKDTMRVVYPGNHTFFDKENKVSLFIDNGNDIKVNYDYEDFNNSIQFSGPGSESSQYIIKKKKIDTEVGLSDAKSFFKLDKEAFETKISHLQAEYTALLAVPNLGEAFKAKEIKNNERVFAYLNKNYKKQYLLATVLGKGKPSPKFVNYQNYKGGTTSLDDFKGKYVYVDVWATWCGPCKREIPNIAKLVKAYKGKNIEFVGISVDDARRNGGSLDKAKNKWKAMIKSKSMAGTQLFSDKAWQSDFVRAYGITGIPRFILIDPQGNIVNANAPRPSQPTLKTLLDGLVK